MDIKLNITLPSGDTGFIEYKRSFVVEGDIISSESIPDNCMLTIDLYNDNNILVRHVECDKKYKDIFVYHPDLVTYDEKDDANRKGLIEFGFPALVVDDINNPYSSLFNGSIKAWYSNTKFKCIIINCSNKETGAIFDDGFNFKDKNNDLYKCLPKGNYYIEASLIHNKALLTKASKIIMIDSRETQLICRFNPESHKKRMFKWAKENNFSYIEDLLPGYLDSYLGNWKHHKGLLKMYRSNDICLFENSKIAMFDYLIDSTSTSYETELAYLQSVNRINSNNITVYYYDIGEAELCFNNIKTACIKKFNDDEYGKIYRIDQIKDISENIYNLNEENIFNTFFDIKNISLCVGDYFAITGVIKPVQLDPRYFILNDDNTYKILDYPKYIQYNIMIDDVDYKEIRFLDMERIDNVSIGKSVYEFYNCFRIKPEWINKTLYISCSCIYEKGETFDINDKIIINVME